MTHAQDPEPLAETRRDPATPATPAAAAEPAAPATPVAPPRPAPIKRTRISGTWVAVIVALVILVFLLIFILQNLATATVNFLGMSGSLPLAVAMLFSAIAGAVLVALIGAARILQLRKATKRAGRAAR
ncbi:lipopolysaccharide assembly protein LapA domain-containing protein [Amycolatopsis acidiphila]|uniref:DUF1049 domain-containing protein n=1 Tax=Amycolatopsis acidiphila TaxID=715473 RepID=A0A558A2R1_9PSEU|nr:lipopolysaccharide assembly protein LapA domain-containing protein [Amycolatopsis acidiphila]TVT18541.1 DUF1049 domain-containing protein [Amycolatopsis acidiphila]UIJ59381.1 lipopolysaccharide assembly protein LapA domain-containing protein [Amycolatopsis acidiphila]GHG80004.1 hypothetical protein GCM10017788_48830 [Amycolatopsis acidiphila]